VARPGLVLAPGMVNGGGGFHGSSNARAGEVPALTGMAVAAAYDMSRHGHHFARSFVCVPRS